MIELAVELASGATAIAVAARAVLARRRPAAIDVEHQVAELERWHEIEWTARLAGYDPDLCIAAADRGEFIVATCARRPARSKRELEQQLFFGPGAVWPVEDANYVQILRPAIAATSWTAVPGNLVERGIVASAVALAYERAAITSHEAMQLSLDELLQ